jgi:hypothetical protein
MVRLLGLVAMRALLQLRRRQRVVGAAIALPGVRRSSLGDSHGGSLSFRADDRRMAPVETL